MKEVTQETMDFVMKHRELTEKYCRDSKKYGRCYIDSNCRQCPHWHEIMGKSKRRNKK